MGFVNFILELLKDPRAAIAGWIAMGVAPTLGFIFLIVFIETGVVFFPFLPGDSLLFAAGVFAAPDAATGKAALPLFWLLPVVWCAPIVGDQCNYFIGHFFGRRIIQSGKVKALTPDRLAKTEHMIEKWGPLAVFLGRFFPFIRTFMPFISGISGMRWSRFTPFSVARRPVLVHAVHAAGLLLRQYSGRAGSLRIGDRADSAGFTGAHHHRFAEGQVRQEEAGVGCRFPAGYDGIRYREP